MCRLCLEQLYPEDQKKDDNVHQSCYDEQSKYMDEQEKYWKEHNIGQ